MSKCSDALPIKGRSRIESEQKKKCTAYSNVHRVSRSLSGKGSARNRRLPVKVLTEKLDDVVREFVSVPECSEALPTKGRSGSKSEQKKTCIA